MEEIIMKLIMFSGEARSYCMEGIQIAKEGNVEGARKLINEASNKLGEAHTSQTRLIQNEAAGNNAEVSLLLVHAQDHLMTAIIVRDLASEIIDLYSKIN